MYNDSQLKITIMSNKPSDQALKSFQRKLYQLLTSKELNKPINPVHDNKSMKPNWFIFGTFDSVYILTDNIHKDISGVNNRGEY